MDNEPRKRNVEQEKRVFALYMQDITTWSNTAQLKKKIAKHENITKHEVQRIINLYSELQRAETA